MSVLKEHTTVCNGIDVTDIALEIADLATLEYKHYGDGVVYRRLLADLEIVVLRNDGILPLCWTY